jgi:hypothetical protein
MLDHQVIQHEREGGRDDDRPEIIDNWATKH